MSQPAIPGLPVRPEGPDELAVEHLPEAGEEPIPGRPVFVEEGPEIGDDHDPPIPDVAEQAAGSLLSGDDPDKRPASVKVETGWASKMLHRASSTLLKSAVSGSAKAGANQIARDGDWSNDSLIEWVASPGHCDQVNLGEIMIHQQDVRRPLGLNRETPKILSPPGS